MNTFRSVHGAAARTWSRQPMCTYLAIRALGRSISSGPAPFLWRTHEPACRFFGALPGRGLLRRQELFGRCVELCHPAIAGVTPPAAVAMQRGGDPAKVARRDCLRDRYPSLLLQPGQQLLRRRHLAAELRAVRPRRVKGGTQRRRPTLLEPPGCLGEALLAQPELPEENTAARRAFLSVERERFCQSSAAKFLTPRALPLLGCPHPSPARILHPSAQPPAPRGNDGTATEPWLGTPPSPPRRSRGKLGPVTPHSGGGDDVPDHHHHSPRHSPRHWPSTGADHTTGGHDDDRATAAPKHNPCCQHGVR
jgi:hypothetical protein